MLTGLIIGTLLQCGMTVGNFQNYTVVNKRTAIVLLNPKNKLTNKPLSKVAKRTRVILKPEKCKIVK